MTSSAVGNELKKGSNFKNTMLTSNDSPYTMTAS